MQSQTPAHATDGRLHELDGLRGWAALAVVLFHLFFELTAGLFPGGWRLPVITLINGHLAVCVFFVLSGEALSSSYFAGGGLRSIGRLAIKRYSRLTIPILASCLIVFALVAFSLTPNHEAGKLILRDDWLGGFLQFPLTLPDLLGYSLFAVYASADPDEAYNVFLWSMHYEMLGSIMVFLLVVVAAMTRRALWVLGAACALLVMLATPLACFAFGMIYAKARHDGFFQRMQNHRVVSWIATIGAALVLIGLGWTMHYHWDWNPDGFLTMIAAIALTGLIFSSKALSTFFATNSFSQFLGRISFPIFLVQFPVIVSLTSFLIIWASASVGLTLPVMFGIGAISLLACVLAAVLFEPIEHFTKYVGNQIVKLLPQKQMTAELS